MGHLSIDQAVAALANARVSEAAMEGNRALDGLADSLRIDCHLLELYGERYDQARAATAYDIRLTVRPLITGRAAPGRIRAEAHDVNAENGRVLIEAEVEQAIVSELLAARRRAGVLAPEPPPFRRARRRYGR
jgi:hypothetical protein